MKYLTADNNDCQQKEKCFDVFFWEYEQTEGLFLDFTLLLAIDDEIAHALASTMDTGLYRTHGEL